MKINQTPTPPNEWLYKQEFVEDPETGELIEKRSNWCVQHIGVIPDDVPVAEWPKYLYHECTDAEKKQWEEEHPEPNPDESGTTEETVVEAE